MEQDGEPREVIDLSQALNETRREPVMEEQYEVEQDLQHVPAIYRLIMKISGGTIKTEGQAKTVAILIIILTNIVTFSLIFKGQGDNVTQEEIPTSATAGEPI